MPQFIEEKLLENVPRRDQDHDNMIDLDYKGFHIGLQAAVGFEWGRFGGEIGFLSPTEGYEGCK